jgi:hypothetical protein
LNAHFAQSRTAWPCYRGTSIGDPPPQVQRDSQADELLLTPLAHVDRVAALGSPLLALIGFI